MKKFPKVFVILLGEILLLLAGCQKPEEPQAPELIAPPSGAVFDSSRVMLIWNEVFNTDFYAIQIEIHIDTQYTLFTGLCKDTTYIFLTDGIINASCNWKVATFNEYGDSLWSESWYFSIQKAPRRPRLIYPPDSSVFILETPSFIWSWDSLIDSYIITIWNTDTNVTDTVKDTTYVMSDNTFHHLNNGIYFWKVDGLYEEFSLSSDTFSFSIQKPLSLDTTYFPFGLGYEWCYERHKQGYYGDQNWDTTYIFTISVVDSQWVSDTMVFYLNEYYHCLPNPVKIWYDSVRIDIDLLGYIHFFTAVINLCSPDTFTRYNSEFYVRLKGDTLVVCGQNSGILSLYIGEAKKETRIKGVGTIRQSHSVSDGGYGQDWEDDRLLYFYNGQDTVYKAPE